MLIIPNKLKTEDFNLTVKAVFLPKWLLKCQNENTKRKKALHDR